VQLREEGRIASQGLSNRRLVMGEARKCGTVVAVFDTWERAERAMVELHTAGYRGDQIKTSAGVAVGDSILGTQEVRPLVPTGAEGCLAGALVDLGVSEEDARYYEGEVAEGRFVVAVDCGGASADAARTTFGRNCGYGRIPPDLR
jgi:hypothetical protein